MSTLAHYTRCTLIRQLPPTPTANQLRPQLHSQIQRSYQNGLAQGGAYWLVLNKEPSAHEISALHSAASSPVAARSHPCRSMGCLDTHTHTNALNNTRPYHLSLARTRLPFGCCGLEDFQPATRDALPQSGNACAAKQAFDVIPSNSNKHIPHNGIKTFSSSTCPP